MLVDNQSPSAPCQARHMFCPTSSLCSGNTLLRSERVYTGKHATINTSQLFQHQSCACASNNDHPRLPACQPESCAQRLTNKNLGFQNIGAPASFLKPRMVFISLELCCTHFKILRSSIKVGSGVFKYRKRKQMFSSILSLLLLVLILTVFSL